LLRVVDAGGATPTEGRANGAVSFAFYDLPAQLLATMHASAADAPASLARIPRRPEMIIDCGKVSKKTRGVILFLLLESGAYPLFLI
jgi:hypothetical protein